jgi:hypothetical protein
MASRGGAPPQPAQVLLALSGFELPHRQAQLKRHRPHLIQCHLRFNAVWIHPANFDGVNRCGGHIDCSRFQRRHRTTSFVTDTQKPCKRLAT